MTDKEFRHLSRSDLIDIIYQMKKEEEELKTRLRVAEGRLAKRELKSKQVGSIAQEAMQLTELFQSAQEAADLYLQGAREQGETILKNANRQARLIIEAANQESKRRLTGSEPGLQGRRNQLRESIEKKKQDR